MNLIKNKHRSKRHAFTLVEMLIVLIIMWILLLFTIWLSGTQIQKIQNKLIKESIISELQTRYSRNLWSSSYAWVIYDHMDITITSWENNITFNYPVTSGGKTLSVTTDGTGSVAFGSSGSSFNAFADFTDWYLIASAQQL